MNYRPPVDSVCVAAPKTYTCPYCKQEFRTTLRFPGGAPGCRSQECKAAQRAKWRENEKKRKTRRKGQS